MIERIIERYLDDHFNDGVYLASVADVYSPHDLINALIQQIHDGVQSRNATRICNATLFLRDLILVAQDNDARQQFKSVFYTSELVKVIENLVTGDNHQVRCDAVYTLGKTGCRESVPLMQHACDIFRERDPFLTSRLLSEIRWLAHDHIWEWQNQLVQRMLVSPRFMTRWATISTSRNPLNSTVENFNIGETLYQLCHDTHPLIREEANYTHLEIEFEAQIRSKPLLLTKAEKRQRRKELKKLEPRFWFNIMEERFGNHRTHDGKLDYTIDELEQFVEQFTGIANPLQKG